MTFEDLDQSIREFTPTDGNWVALEPLFELVFSSSQPARHYHAIYNLFERFPDEDGSGVFWSAVHAMEKIGNYEEQLVHYFRRWPSLMTKIMLTRLKNSGQSTIGSIQISKLLSS